jgi:hypothetical protein
MERQMQGQQWEANNMSLAQKTQLDMNAQQQQWQRQRQEFEWNNPSAYQQASIEQDRARTGIAQQNANLQRMEFNANYMPNPNGKGFVPRPKPEAPLNFDQRLKVQTTANNVTNALSTIGDVRALVQEAGGRGFQAISGRSQAMQQELEAALVPIVTSMFKPTGDAPSESELKQIKAYIGDITSLGTTNETKIKRLNMLEQHARQMWQPFSAYGQLPEYKRGGSAFGQQYLGSAGVMSKDAAGSKWSDVK